MIEKCTKCVKRGRCKVKDDINKAMQCDKIKVSKKHRARLDYFVIKKSLQSI